MDTLIGAGKSLLPVVGIALVAGLLFAGCKHRGWCGPHRNWTENPEKAAAKVTERIDDVLDEVDATPEQREQVHELKDRLLSDLLALGQERQELRDALRFTWEADRVDADPLHAMADRKAESVKEFGHKAIDAMVELHDLFTPEQRARFLERIDAHGCR